MINPGQPTHKAKRIDNGDYVEGFYYFDYRGHHILRDNGRGIHGDFIDPDTLVYLGDSS